MLIESSRVNNYLVLKIKEDLGLNSDLTELKNIITEYVDEGITKIALEFTQDSYLYTKSIAILVQCCESIREKNGTMALINPNEDIIDILETINFDSLIQICDSEEKLGAGRG
ncbi:MAG: STAS domain-containing protein [Chitinivibrionales bacterium]|nr:STAS domain-containing protein [Chitinivibrionales bacterium]